MEQKDEYSARAESPKNSSRRFKISALLLAAGILATTTSCQTRYNPCYRMGDPDYFFVGQPLEESNPGYTIRE